MFRTLTAGSFLVGTSAPADLGAEPEPPAPGTADDERRPDAVAGRRPNGG